MCRETEAHNLPMIQGQEQSDIWGVDFFGKRAVITKRNYIKEKARLEVEIEDQFGQLIERKIDFSEKKIEITDVLKKQKINGNFISLIHLASGIEANIYETNSETNLVYCKVNEGLKFSISTKANVRISDYIYFPEFCTSVGAKMLILSNKEEKELKYAIKW